METRRRPCLDSKLRLPTEPAFDDETGEVLWQSELDDLPNSNIVTYRVAGKQYIAIVVGLISDNAEDWEMTYRRFAPDEGLPLNESPKGGAAIWAFALPDTL